MCEIKIGDYVKAKNKVWKVKEINGELLRLREFNTGCEGLIFCNEAKKLPVDYILSNRHRLAIEIAESGFNATELSLAAGKNKYYFTNEIKQSRFLNRGDISEKRFNELLLKVLAAEDLLNADNPSKEHSSGYYSPKPEIDTAEQEKKFAKILLTVCLIIIVSIIVKTIFF